jgi:hypothetical protein
LKKCTIALILLCAAATPASAQTSSASQLKKLDWFIGKWEGGGWVAGTNGVRMEMKLSSECQPKLGGTVLLSESLLSVSRPGERLKTVVDGALGIIFWDEKSSSFRMRNHRIDGEFTEAALVVEGRSFQSRQPSAIRGGEVRFNFKVDDQERLILRGEESKDGKEWKQFLEFTLQRVPKE